MHTSKTFVYRIFPQFLKLRMNCFMNSVIVINVYFFQNLKTHSDNGDLCYLHLILSIVILQDK